MNENTTRNLVTGYAGAKILNAILTANGRDEVPAQLVYQYMSKGFIYTVELNGKKYIDLNGTQDDPKNSKGDFGPWMVKYLARKGIVLEQPADENENQEALFEISA
jgi:hypothetical protein